MFALARDWIESNINRVVFDMNGMKPQGGRIGILTGARAQIVLPSVPGTRDNGSLYFSRRKAGALMLARHFQGVWCVLVGKHRNGLAHDFQVNRAFCLQRQKRSGLDELFAVD